jgi:hypothetical protein
LAVGELIAAKTPASYATAAAPTPDALRTVTTKLPGATVVGSWATRTAVAGPRLTVDVAVRCKSPTAFARLVARALGKPAAAAIATTRWGAPCTRIGQVIVFAYDTDDDGEAGPVEFAERFCAAAERCPGLRDAAVLLKVWLDRRGLLATVGGHWACATLLSLVTEHPPNRFLSSYKLFRLALGAAAQTQH